jgi:hypothetical protein
MAAPFPYLRSLAGMDGSSEKPYLLLLMGSATGNWLIGRVRLEYFICPPYSLPALSPPMGSSTQMKLLERTPVPNPH